MISCDGIMVSAITAAAAVATAAVNMIGSVLILWIRARYQYHDSIGDKAKNGVIRDVSDTGK
jgi:hypothetical protein